MKTLFVILLLIANVSFAQTYIGDIAPGESVGITYILLVSGDITKSQFERLVRYLNRLTEIEMLLVSGDITKSQFERLVRDLNRLTEIEMLRMDVATKARAQRLVNGISDLVLKRSLDILVPADSSYIINLDEQIKDSTSNVDDIEEFILDEQDEIITGRWEILDSIEGFYNEDTTEWIYTTDAVPSFQDTLLVWILAGTNDTLATLDLRTGKLVYYKDVEFRGHTKAEYNKTNPLSRERSQ